MVWQKQTHYEHNQLKINVRTIPMRCTKNKKNHRNEYPMFLNIQWNIELIRNWNGTRKVNHLRLAYFFTLYDQLMFQLKIKYIFRYFWALYILCHHLFLLWYLYYCRIIRRISFLLYLLVLLSINFIFAVHVIGTT